MVTLDGPRQRTAQKTLQLGEVHSPPRGRLRSLTAQRLEIWHVVSLPSESKGVADAMPGECLWPRVPMQPENLLDKTEKISGLQGER